MFAFTKRRCCEILNPWPFIDKPFDCVSSKGPCKDEDNASASSDSLGEQLFDLVEVYNTGHSQKITGRNF